jgi:hypothetical protein
MCKFQLVWLMHMRITTVLVKLIFSSCRRFQNGKKAAINFCVKLKKTAPEIWCFMYDPETKRQIATWLSPKKPKAQKLRMQKLRVKTMLTAFLMLKVLLSFIMNLCRKNCLRSLGRWDRVFESYSRHGCLCAFILCLCCPVCVGSGLATRPRSPTDCV